MNTLTAIKRETFPMTSVEDWLKLRAKDVTSTEVSALFGLSPYVTPFELWHRKKSAEVVEIQPNERMKWGTRLQDSIAAGIAEDQKWNVLKRDSYERLPDQRLGASFDFTIIGGVAGDGLLEIKNVDPLVVRDEWVIEGDDVEAPPHVEMQVQHQLLVSGLQYAYIGALVGGNHAVLIRREPIPSIIESIIAKTEEFWESIAAGREPKPDFSRDSDFITKLYKNVRPGSVVDVSADPQIAALAEAYGEAGAAIKEQEAIRKGIKAKLLMKIGDSEKAKGTGFTISASTVAPAPVAAYTRASYRDFRVSFKTGKKED